MADVQTAQPVPQPRPKKSWFGRNWWWVLLLILIGGGLICGGICTGIVLYATGKAKDSEVYRMSFDAVSKDPVVLEKLGNPIDEPPIVGGAVGEDEGMVVFPVTGPEGKTATVTAQGRKVDGQWGLTTVEVEFDDGSRHSLEIDKEHAGALEPPPKWSPPGEVGAGDMPME